MIDNHRDSGTIGGLRHLSTPSEDAGQVAWGGRHRLCPQERELSS
jgi:hypothetical protein